MQSAQPGTIEKQVCLSSKRLMHYSQGRISKREKVNIESHLLSCEKCILTLQHVLDKKDKVEANRIFSELFEEPFKVKKEKKQPKRIYFDFVSIKRIARFAFFILIAGAGIYACCLYLPPLIKKTTELVKANESSTSSLSPSTQREKPVTEEANSPTESNNEAKPILIAETERPIEQNPVNIPVTPSEEKPKPAPLVSDKIENLPPISETKEPVKTPPVKSVPSPGISRKPAAVNEPTSVSNYKISLRISGLPGKTDQYKESLGELFNSIDKANYADALKKIQKLFFNLPTDVNAKYYRGYVYYLMGDNEKSLTDFESILDNSNKTFYEDAKWYKILLLNRNSQFDESKKMLNEVIAENGSYRRKAQQLLDLIAGK